MGYPHEIAHGGFENPHCNGGKDLWSFENPRQTDGMSATIWYRAFFENPRRKGGKGISIWYRIPFENPHRIGGKHISICYRILFENLCLHGWEDHFITKWYLKIFENFENLRTGIEQDQFLSALHLNNGIHTKRDALTLGPPGHVPNHSDGDCYV